MARLKFSGVRTTVGTALTASATTLVFGGPLTHAGGALVPTIAGGDVLPLSILDASGGLAEIVWLTAYTSGQGSGTVVRGQEGTAAGVRAVGSRVVASATAADLIDPDLIIRADRAPELARNLMLRTRPGPTTWFPTTGVTVGLDATNTWDGLPTTSAVLPNPNDGVYTDPGVSVPAPVPGAEHWLSLPVRAPLGTTIDVVIGSLPGGVLIGERRNVPATGAMQVIDVSAVPSADRTAIYAIAYVGGGSGARTISVGPPTITRGAPARPFNGDGLGARWAGVVNASESIKMLPTKAEVDMLRWLDAGLASGVGSPEGQIVAPVGARYVDKAGALPANGGTGTGAIEWTKMRGTGAIGWDVTAGDTEFREMKTLLLGGATANTIKLRRRAGGQCTLIYEGLTRLNPYDAILQLPAGWGLGNSENAFITSRDDYITGGLGLFLAAGSAFCFITQTTGGAFTAGSKFSGVAHWVSPTYWPAALLGTASPVS